MATGVVKPVIPITRFTAPSGADAVQTVVAPHMRVDQYTEATILARLHTATTWTGTATVQIAAYADGHTEEDPSTDFLESAVLAGSVTFTQGTDNAPAFYATKITGDIGGMLTFVVITDPDQGEIDVEISADVVLKSAS